MAARQCWVGLFDRRGVEPTAPEYRRMPIKLRNGDHIIDFPMSRQPWGEMTEFRIFSEAAGEFIVLHGAVRPKITVYRDTIARLTITIDGADHAEMIVRLFEENARLKRALPPTPANADPIIYSTRR